MRIQRSSADWQPEKTRDGNRYYSSFFVNAFTLRQYSPYLNFRDSAAGWKTVAKQVVTENYYQTIRALATTALAPGARVVDIGCALGRMTVEMVRAGAASAVGLDISPMMVKRATDIAWSTRGKPVWVDVPVSPVRTVRGWITGLGLGASVEFLAADAQATPIADESADMALCLNVLHRVQQPKAVLAELTRIVKKNGSCILSNSYDWLEEFTQPDEWFEDVIDVLPSADWHIVTVIDAVPYETAIHDRKITRALNQVILMRRR
jgi:ubiquinone/menaquinone biosynthesis C-methylase UbiE